MSTQAALLMMLRGAAPAQPAATVYSSPRRLGVSFIMPLPLTTSSSQALWSSEMARWSSSSFTRQQLSPSRQPPSPYLLRGRLKEGRRRVRLVVKQVPEDDPLLSGDEGSNHDLEPLSSSLLSASLLGPAALAGVLLAITMLVYMAAPHGAEAQASWDHLTQELSSRLIPPGYNFYESLLSGASAGVSRGLSRLCTFPADTVKTRQQAVLRQDIDADKLKAKAGKVDTSRLFDGILPMLLIAGPANAAFFVTHDYVLAAFNAASLFPRSGMWLAELSASLLASLPANAIRIPAEVTKQRVQAGVEKTAADATRTILKQEGWKGLYVGGKAHLLRELPFNAIQFLTFRNLKGFLVSEHIKVGIGEKALVGAIAAGVAGLATQPFDTVKSLEMIDKNRSVVSKESWTDTMFRIYSRYGIAGLYLGLAPRLLLCSVGGAFYFLASEAVKGLFTPLA